MKRLSEELQEILGEQDFCFTPEEMKAVRMALCRLAAYEDTGLRPEEILTGKELAEAACAMNLLKEYQSIGPVGHFRKLAQAEKDKRLVLYPPNDPLTLEELRKMDGEPVWIVGVSSIQSFQGHWDICEWENGEAVNFPHCMESPDITLYGKTWLAYRRRPKEET